MQDSRDNLDNIIFSSNYNQEISKDYNEKLMRKLDTERRTEHIKFSLFNVINKNTVAISFILSGILILAISKTNLQYSIVELQCNINNKIISIENKYGKSKNSNGFLDIILNLKENKTVKY